ncbi:MAG: histidinol-phosphate transaminase [Pseudomonadota bacterium]
MHPTLKPRPGILDLKTYVQGESQIRGANRIVKLSANENPLGPSPKATAAFRHAADHLHIYPEGAHEALREAIGGVYGMDPAQIICGAGSDEIFTFLCTAYAGPGDEVIHTRHGFSMYKIAARVSGATPVEVDETERTADVDAILAACTEKTKLVFVANPNNPTGTMLPDAEVARLADGLPEQALLVLDGAYAEYVRGYDAGLAMIEARENVMMTRTFSKIHGLGGLRIGYGFGPAHVIDVLNRVRGPFNVSAAGLATAEAAIRDVDYTEHCALQNEVWRDWMIKALRELGITVDDSYANFVLPRFGTEEAAEAADAKLRKRGLLVRRMGGYQLPDALRITVGDEAACRAVIEALS